MVELIETFSLWYFLPFKKNFCTSINVFTSFAKNSFNDEKKNRKSNCYEKKNWEDSLKVCTLILTSLQNVKIFGGRKKIQFCFCKSSHFGSILQSISLHSVRETLVCSTILCSTIQMDLVRPCFGLRSTNRTKH